MEWTYPSTPMKVVLFPHQNWHHRNRILSMWIPFRWVQTQSLFEMQPILNVSSVGNLDREKRVESWFLCSGHVLRYQWQTLRRWETRFTCGKGAMQLYLAWKFVEFQYEMVHIALDQSGSPNERKLAFSDKFQDLFIMQVRSAAPNQRLNNQRIRKLCTWQCFESIARRLSWSALGTNIGSFRWNDKNAMLAGIADGKLNVWLYPNVVFVDQSLLDKTIYRIESA